MKRWRVQYLMNGRSMAFYFDTWQAADQYRLNVANQTGLSLDKVRLYERKPAGGWFMVKGVAR